MNFVRRLRDWPRLRLWRARFAWPFRRRFAYQRSDFGLYARIEQKFEDGIIERLGGFDRRQMRRFQSHSLRPGNSARNQSTHPRWRHRIMLANDDENRMANMGEVGAEIGIPYGHGAARIPLGAHRRQRLFKTLDDLGVLLAILPGKPILDETPAPTLRRRLLPQRGCVRSRYPRCRSAPRHWRERHARSAPAHDAAATAR